MSIVAKYIEEKSPGTSLKEKLEYLSLTEQVALSAVLLLSPSANNLQEILDLAAEIASRDQISLSAIFNEKEIKQIATDDKDSKKNRIKRIKSHLELLRYPIQNALHKEIAKCKSEIAKATGLAIEVPENFEGDSLALRLKFSSAEDCKKLAEKLGELAGLDSTRRIFSILRGEF